MVNHKIKIGVTYTGTDEKHSNYVHWLRGDDPVEILLLSPTHTDLQLIQHFDGIVLSGGIDMHPKFYGNANLHYPNAPLHFQEKRDAFEMAVFNLSRQHDIPVLGVCRGMQLVNCMLGGTLTQDIGPLANVVHRYDHNDKAHGLNIRSGTLLHSITGLERTVTNSAHHQCIQQLGKGLVVNCLADDGIIEGIEWEDTTGQAFFLGIQWHPERLYKMNLGNAPASKNLRDHFINVLKKNRQHQYENN